MYALQSYSHFYLNLENPQRPVTSVFFGVSRFDLHLFQIEGKITRITSILKHFDETITMIYDHTSSIKIEL